MKAKTKKTKKKTGRPLTKIDPDQVLKLAQIMCTHEEIGAFFNVDKSTISKRFSTIVAKGHEMGKMSLRRKQFKLCDKSAAMCIWLGKQYLGQKERHIIEFPAELLNEKIGYIPQNGDRIPEEFKRFIMN